MQFFIFFGIVQGLLFLVHFVVYKALVKGFVVTDPHMLLALKIIFGILSVSFFVSNVGFTSDSALGNSLYYSAAVWLGTLWWLFLASVAIGIVYATVYAIGGDAFIGQSLNLIRSLTFVCVVAALAMSGYGMMQGNILREVSYTVELPNLPQEWKGKTVAFIADTHFGKIHRESHAYDVINKLSRKNLEAVFIGGDFYDGPRMDFDSVARPFGEFKTTYGTFFVTGNHETYRNEPYVQHIEKNGIIVLQNDFVNLRGLTVGGVEYSNNTRAEDLAMTLQKMRSNITAEFGDAPYILLKHVPDNLDVVRDSGVNLVLSGHTHKGQVWPFSLLARFIYKGFEYGNNTLGKLRVITTSGAGTWGPPQRIGTQREIVYITFE